MPRTYLATAHSPLPCPPRRCRDDFQACRRIARRGDGAAYRRSHSGEPGLYAPAFAAGSFCRRRPVHLRLHFWGRSATGNPIRAVFEKASPDYDKSLAQNLALTSQWKEYAFTFTAPSYEASQSSVHFVLGQQTGTVEIARITLEDYGVNPQSKPIDIGRDLYGGHPHDDSWRPAANARIHKYRMGELVVRVVDAHGRPIPNAVVHVRQTRMRSTSARPSPGTALCPKPRRREVPACFTQGLQLYSPGKLAQMGRLRRPGWPLSDKMLTWCRDHDLPVRGHNLFWPSYMWLPDSIKPLRGQAMRDAVHDHVIDYVTKTKGRVVVWDVVNEAVTSHEVYEEAGKDLIAKAYFWAP